MRHCKLVSQNKKCFSSHLCCLESCLKASETSYCKYTYYMVEKSNGVAY